MLTVRKQLSASEVNPSLAFYDAGCDCVKQPVDGTNVLAPAMDTRTSTAWQKPSLTGSDISCRAASNWAANFKSWLDGTILALDQGTTALSGLTFAIAAFAVIFPPSAPVDALILLFVDGTSLLFSIGTTVVSGAFTDAVYEMLKCAYLANCATDGSVDPTQYTSFMDACYADFPGGTVHDVLAAMFAFSGNVGASNWAATGSASADCGDCHVWCEVIEFTATDGGFSADFVDGTGANYVPGVGWTQNIVSGTSGTFIIRSSIDASSMFETITVTYSAAGHVTSTVVYSTLSGTETILEIQPAGDGTNLTFSWAGSESLDTLALQVGNESGGGAPGTSTISRLEIAGSGTAPGIGDPC